MSSHSVAPDRSALLAMATEIEAQARMAAYGLELTETAMVMMRGNKDVVVTAERRIADLQRSAATLAAAAKFIRAQAEPKPGILRTLRDYIARATRGGPHNIEVSHAQQA